VGVCWPHAPVVGGEFLRGRCWWQRRRSSRGGYPSSLSHSNRRTSRTESDRSQSTRGAPMTGATHRAAITATGGFPASRPPRGAYAQRTAATANVSGERCASQAPLEWVPLRRVPPREGAPRTCPSRAPVVRASARPLTRGAAPGSLPEPWRRLRCAPRPESRPMLRSTPPLLHLGIPEPGGAGAPYRPPAAAPLGAQRHRPRVGWAPPRPTIDGASSDKWSCAARCHFARVTAAAGTPKALCSSWRCRSTFSSDSASVGRIVPRPLGVPPARVPDDPPTISTRGGPKGGAPSGSCPSGGEG